MLMACITDSNWDKRGLAWYFGLPLILRRNQANSCASLIFPNASGFTSLYTLCVVPRVHAIEYHRISKENMDSIGIFEVGVIIVVLTFHEKSVFWGLNLNEHKLFILCWYKQSMCVVFVLHLYVDIQLLFCQWLYIHPSFLNKYFNYFRNNSNMLGTL